MIKPIAALLVMNLCLAGCASSPSAHERYIWGNYEDDLYEYYHKPESKERVAANHLRLIANIESKGRVPAPGLYAEAGTFMLEAGNRSEAVVYYQKEFDAWPESRPLMGRLIQNLKGQ